jgi:hypothetical protein
MGRLREAAVCLSPWPLCLASSPKRLYGAIQKAFGLRVDESSHWVDAPLSDGTRVQTRFLCALFAKLLSDPVEVPVIWDTLQFVLSNVLEDEA